MAEDEPGTETTAKRPKKTALQAPPPEPKAEGKAPTPHEVRTAKKAELVAWAESLGLSTEGKADDLRKRLLDHLEAEAPAEKAEAPKAERPAKPEKGEKKAERKEKPAKEEEAEEKEEAEKVHEPRLKPKLDPRTRGLLRMRAEMSARRPPFHRQEWFRYDKFGDEWRKPQGGQSKLRRHFGYRWNLPSIGFRGPRAVRGLHPSGFREILVHNPRQLEGLDPEREAVRIAHGVGTRKRELIEKACQDKGIRVLNRMVNE